MAGNFFLERGERGLLVGQTGSGKSIDAIYQLRQAENFPVIVFDTKIEPAFEGLPEGDERLELVESLPELMAIGRRKKKFWPDFILVRPGIHEMQNFMQMDQYSFFVYDNMSPVSLYYDEMYNWHDGGKVGNGFIALLTRGRSRGKTTLMATQRPAWISRFCLTEAQKYYIHYLGDDRDRKTLASVIPNFDKYPLPPKHHFYHFEHGMKEPVLFAPVPMQDTTHRKISKDWWL